MDFVFIADVFPKLLAGLPLTLSLAVLSLAGGALIALLLSGLRSTSWVGAQVVNFYVYIFRGTPLLIQIFLIYYGLAQFPAVRHSLLWPLLREPYVCAVLALMLNDAAYTSEILRGGLRAVSKGALEAAKVSGMSRVTLLRRIVLPLAIRQALPAYGVEVTSMVKATSLASVVTLMEVTGVARAEVSQSYRAIEVFLCAAVIYLVLVTVIARAVHLLEVRLTPYRSPALARSPA
ncbi:nopaline ABC transporter permease NocM [soil metagenome]